MVGRDGERGGGRIVAGKYSGGRTLSFIQHFPGLTSGACYNV